MIGALSPSRWKVTVAWSRLAILVAVYLVAVSSLTWLLTNAIADSKAQARRSTELLALLAADHADHILVEAFFELELFARTVGTDPAGDAADMVLPNFTAPIVLLDANGGWSPRSDADGWLRSDGDAAAALRSAARAPDRMVSEPFASPATGHPVSALSLPLYDDQGARSGTVVGLFDLERHVGPDLGEVVGRLGASAHADFVGASGTVLASTVHTTAGTAGWHPDFYQSAAASGAPVVSEVPAVDRPASPAEPHVMAYAPMGAAHWGVALGTSRAEAFAAADDLRRRGMQLGAAVAAMAAVGIALVTVGFRPAGKHPGTRTMDNPTR